MREKRACLCLLSSHRTLCFGSNRRARTGEVVRPAPESLCHRALDLISDRSSGSSTRTPSIQTQGTSSAGPSNNRRSSRRKAAQESLGKRPSEKHEPPDVGCDDNLPPRLSPAATRVCQTARSVRAVAPWSTRRGAARIGIRSGGSGSSLRTSRPPGCRRR